MQINNKFNRGDSIWIVEQVLKPKHYIITGPFEVISINALINDSGCDIEYTINKKAELGLARVREDDKGLCSTLDEACNRVAKNVEEDNKEKEEE